MPKLRLEVTKDDEIRFISHLEYARAIERAIRRAKLPAAYSEGFNPHMKFAFASALALGVTSSVEYLDLELNESIPVDTVVKKLSKELPPGIRIHKGKYIPDKASALMSIVNLASYTISLDVPSETASAQVAKSIEEFNARKSLLYTRKSLKGTREIEIKEYLTTDIGIKITNENIKLFMDIKIMPNGSVKPSEVLAALIDAYDLTINGAQAEIHRSGLYVEAANQKLSPLEVN